MSVIWKKILLNTFEISNTHGDLENYENGAHHFIKELDPFIIGYWTWTKSISDWRFANFKPFKK